MNSRRVHGQFKVYVKDFLSTNGFRSLPIVPFRGNRFNILFFTASYLYFLKDQMTEFFEKFGASNKLLKCVQADLEEPLYLAGCRALGLISKVITTPLWRCLEDKSVHILELPDIYGKIQVALQRGTEHPEEFMDGSLSPFSTMLMLTMTQCSSP